MNNRGLCAMTTLQKQRRDATARLLARLPAEIDAIRASLGNLARPAPTGVRASR